MELKPSQIMSVKKIVWGMVSGNPQVSDDEETELTARHGSRQRHPLKPP